MQRIRCRTDEGGRIVYRDYNNPKERKASKEALTKTISNAEQKGQEDLNRSFTWDDMKQIEAILERQEEIIEEQEKRIENQEERIAIMTEGGHIEIIEELLEKYRNAESGNIWEHSCRIHEDEAELNKEIEEYRRRAGIKPPKEGEAE